MKKDKILLRYKFSEEEDWIEIPVYSKSNPKWDNQTFTFFDSNNDSYSGYVSYFQSGFYNIRYQPLYEEYIIFDFMNQECNFKISYMWNSCLRIITFENNNPFQNINISHNFLKGFKIDNSTKFSYSDNIKIQGNNKERDLTLKFLL